MDAAGVNTTSESAPHLDVRRLLIDMSRFLRLSVVGFSVMVPLIGAAAVSPVLSGAQLAVLAAVGLAFHIFVYVSNDVFDLPIDRTQPLRAGSPLVRGLVRPSVALAIAFVPVPLASIIHSWTGGSPVASAVLMASMGSGLIYNLYGKQLRFPLLSDAVQGLAWVALAMYGALATGLPLRAPVAWLAATIFFYILLVNGLHGGLRDLANDARHGARTTAIYLGAHATAAGRLIVPRVLALHGLALQISLLLLASLCVILHWPDENAIPWQSMVAAIGGAHLILLWLARAALRATSKRSEMLRFGMLHLFLSIGVVCLPFAFFANMLATLVIVVWYALPLLILFVWRTVRVMKMRSRAGAVALLSLVMLSAAVAADDGVHVLPREEIVRAMRAQRSMGYNLLATANGARFNAGVILDVARAASRRDPLQTAIVLDHRDYFEAYLQVTGIAADDAPAFIRVAHQHGEDQYVDYRAQKVIKRIGQSPDFAVNVVTGWTGGPERYSYEDRSSKPSLSVTHERITSYRLLDFGDMILFDDIQGISGRALDGLLGMIFKLIGDARAVRSFIAIAPDGMQVTLTTGRKGFAFTTSATVDLLGRGDKGVPAKRKDLKRIEARLVKAYREPAPQYVPIDRAAPFRWIRINPDG